MNETRLTEYMREQLAMAKKAEAQLIGKMLTPDQIRQLLNLPEPPPEAKAGFTETPDPQPALPEHVTLGEGDVILEIRDPDTDMPLITVDSSRVYISPLVSGEEAAVQALEVIMNAVMQRAIDQGVEMLKAETLTLRQHLTHKDAVIRDLEAKLADAVRQVEINERWSPAQGSPQPAWNGTSISPAWTYITYNADGAVSVDGVAQPSQPSTGVKVSKLPPPPQGKPRAPRNWGKVNPKGQMR